MGEWRGELLNELKQDAIHFGDFVLSSGVKSYYYINCREVTLSPKGAWLVANAMLDSLEAVDADAIGGPTLAADPIAAGVAIESWHRGHPMRAFIVRKEAKGHGLQQQVEGPVHEGDRVIVVDDILTTGGSLLQAIDAVESVGLKVAHVAVLLDRLEGGADRIRARGYPFTAIYTFDDIRSFVEAHRPAAQPHGA